MLYIIVGRDDSKGVLGDDCSNLMRYTELGWELVGTRLEVIKMLQQGEISINDTTIVTLEDRKFLYTKIFKNVISYAEFKKVCTDQDVINDIAYDKMYKTQSLDFLDGRKFVSGEKEYKYDKYKRFYTDYDLIVNFDFVDTSGLHNNEEYYCVCLRYRSHTPKRNSPEAFWKKLLAEISKTGRKIFVVGRGSESMCDNSKIVYIDKLSVYASLINNKLCQATIGSPTGTMLLGAFCCRNKIITVDHSRCLISDEENNAVYGGHCVRFMDIPYINICDTTDINKIMRLIK